MRLLLEIPDIFDESCPPPEGAGTSCGMFVIVRRGRGESRRSAMHRAWHISSRLEYGDVSVSDIAVITAEAAVVSAATLGCAYHLDFAGLLPQR